MTPTIITTVTVAVSLTITPTLSITLIMTLTLSLLWTLHLTLIGLGTEAISDGDGLDLWPGYLGHRGLEVCARALLAGRLGVRIIQD